MKTTKSTRLPAIQSENGLTVADLTKRTKDFLNASKAEATRKAYRSDIEDWKRFCKQHRLSPLPGSAESVAMYLSSLATEGKKTATIVRRISALSQYHQWARHESPTKSALVKGTLQGIRRTIGSAQVGKEALTMADVRLMLSKMPDTLLGKRDRALILIGLSSAVRRKSLVSLSVADVREVDAGIIINITHSKTDSQGHGFQIGIPRGSHIETDPVAAYHDWITTAGITEGPVFRAVLKGTATPKRLSDKAVSRRIKHWVKKIGLDPDRFGGHSLRVSFVTITSQNNAPLSSVMDQTGHRSFQQARKYQRRANLLGDGNAARYLGL